MENTMYIDACADHIEEEQGCENNARVNFRDVYLKRIGKYPILTADDEIELAKRIEKGDKDAFERMVLSNLRLVVNVVVNRKWKNLPFEDAIQEGNLGLIKAVGRYNHRKGCRFSTYAVWWIRQALELGDLGKTRMIRVPIHVAEAIDFLRKAERDYVDRFNRQPSDDELSALTGWSLKKIQKIHACGKTVLSLNVPIDDECSVTMGEQIMDHKPGPEKIALRRDLNDTIDRLLSCLSVRDRHIVERRYGLNGREQETLESIGSSLGITRERVRQIVKEAFVKMRNNTRDMRCLQEYRGYNL